MRLIATLMLWIMLLSGCSTMQAVGHSKGSSLAGQVTAGDTVKVVTSDGQIRKFVVTEITPDELVGGDTRIARADITRLQVKAIHNGRTFGAAFGAAATVLIIVLAAAAASVVAGP